MSTDERRTIEELAARYDLEPALRDIYVEGAFDAAVIGWVLREAGCYHAAVYEIDTVEVTSEALAKHGLDEGNKGRVIALCVELRPHVSPSNQVTGVVDRDYDSVLGRSYSNEILLFTDYSCMEMYFFDDEVLGRFCHFVLRKNEGMATNIRKILTPVLNELFFIRSTNEFLKLGLWNWARLT